jgi:rhodanese-related sulfurtransferase
MEAQIQEPIATGCIAQEEMKKLLQQRGSLVLLVDVRSFEEFVVKHIPGAINIPMNELERRSEVLSKDSCIITICGKGGGRSAQAADFLKQKGFHATWLCGGTEGFTG